jgi:hypothetical protein
VKRWKWLILVLVIAGLIYFGYKYRSLIGLGGSSSAQTAAMSWRTVTRSGEGFQIELPASPQLSQTQAANESGGNEQINLLVASPSAQTTFSIAWADSPPVVRVNGGAPERILTAARNQFLSRTQTTAVSESPTTVNGLSARDLVAQNSGGGVMDARLIVAGERLYMLTAAYPSMDARREQDVIRFYNSFKMTGNTQIPQFLPAASSSSSKN